VSVYILLKLLHEDGVLL